jgi:RNA polymerase sigma-70 factor (ECF subfamily)
MAPGDETSEQRALRDPDTHLMLRVGADEPGAFEQLMGRYRHRLFGVVRRQVAGREDAEDLVQEVFLRVYRARKRYRARSKFSTWLFTIAINLTRNNRRRQAVVQLYTPEYVAVDSQPAEESLFDSGDQPVGRIEHEELAAAVRRAVQGLNERQRRAVLLNKFEGLGYEDIARLIGLTPQAVKSLLFRARANLRQALRRYVENA